MVSMHLLPPVATYAGRWLAPFFPDVLWRVETRARVAYLTFDDGPTTELTRDLLDLLRRYDAQATFFLIGRHAKEHPRLVEAIDRAGHRIGNHSYSHPYPWSTPTSRVTAELDHTTKVLQEIIQRPIRCMRPPYGQLTPSMRQWCARHQQRMVLWDVMPGDFRRTTSADYLVRFVRRYIRPGSIIVLHDNPIVQPKTVKALQAILRSLDAEGWRFEAL